MNRRTKNRAGAGSFLSIAVEPGQDEIHADIGEEYRSEADDCHPRRALTAPAAHEATMKIDRVNEPRDQ